MSHRVWKYEVGAPNATNRAFIDLPAGARPLSVDLQNDVMFVWALIDTGYEHETDMQATGPHRLIVANTGDEIPGFPDGARFLGTVKSSTGIVWHVWDGDAETTA